MTGGERAWLSETDDGLRVLLPVQLKLRGGGKWLTRANPADAAPRLNPSMVKALKRAHAALRANRCSSLRDPIELIGASSPADPYLRKLCAMAFLAPDIQRAIIQGRQPRWLSLEGAIAVGAMPSWKAQRAALQAGAEGQWTAEEGPG